MAEMTKALSTELMPEALRPKESLVDDDYPTTIATRLQATSGLLTFLEDGAVVSDPAQVESMRSARDGLAKVREVLALGYEPTRPPPDWYSGLLPTKAGGPAARWWWTRSAYQELARKFFGWPGVRAPVVSNSYETTVYRFRSPIPAWAWRRIEDARKVFGADQMVVYSPSKHDFSKQTVLELSVDPVVIGRVVAGGEYHYFEVARWDISRDLIHMHQLASGKVKS